jgi:hypothetical protein
MTGLPDSDDDTGDLLDRRHAQQHFVDAIFAQ